MADNEEVRERIFQAAKGLFMQYGLGKTTMNDIARRSDMSAANIYRFFKGKYDLAAEMTKHHFAETEEHIRGLIRGSKLPPVELLTAVVIAKLRINYRMCEETPNALEMVNYITEKRVDLVAAHKETVCSMVAEVIAEGNRTGVFDADDIVATADIFLKATTLFHCPVLMNLHTLEEMEQYAAQVVQLLARGLEKR